MHLHCIAKEVYIPESKEELIHLISQQKNKKKEYRLLGACSNVILPAKLNVPVIFLTSFNKECSIEDGVIVVGASVRIQHLIREAQKSGLGGIEYLFSVPCTVGGATVMNAGRGNGNQSIGNFVVAVQCLNLRTGEIEVLSKEECHLSFRNSTFLHGDKIVLTTVLKLEQKKLEKIEECINERKQYALEKLDDRRPSCGSIFNQSDMRIMKLMKGLRIGGAEWSKKTNNWISNTGNAKNWQVRLLVYLACLMHKIAFKPYHLEVEIWKK